MSPRWLLLVIAGCGRLGFAERTDSGSDVAAPDVRACASFGPWQPAQPITELDTPLYEWGAEIRGDGLELYFDSEAGTAQDIYVASRPDRDAAFGTASLVAELSTGSREGDTTLTGDRLEIFFDSNRSGNDCLYTATRPTTADPWGPVTRLDALCATIGVEGPFISRDGLTLYYNTSVSSFEGDILVATRASRSDPFGPGTPIAAIAGGAVDGYPFVTPDGLTMYFQTGSTPRLWVMTRASAADPFGNPHKIAELDTGVPMIDASATDDGLELYFANNPPGTADLYVSRRACL